SSYAKHLAGQKSIRRYARHHYFSDAAGFLLDDAAHYRLAVDDDGHVEEKADRKPKYHARHARAAPSTLCDSLGTEVERDEGQLLGARIVDADGLQALRQN